MPIFGVTGLPGSGKTAFVTRVMFRLRKSARGRSRRVYVNYPLYLPYGEPVRFVENWTDVFPLEGCDVVLDEMHLLLGSRNWQRHGDEIAGWVSQLRKRKVNLWYTTQDITSVDKFVRERTEIMYQMQSFVKLGVFTFWSFNGCKLDRAHRISPGWFVMNKEIFDCYDTGFVVSV